MSHRGLHISKAPLLYIYIAELQWLEHLWNHENMFETGVVQAKEFNHRARSGNIIGIYF